jgi:hypothetical protein
MPANTQALDALLQDVAQAYEALEHSPQQVQTALAYRQLTGQLYAQFEVLRAFVAVNFSDRDPYLSSAHMFANIEKRRWFSVYTVAEMPEDHPFAAVSPYEGQVVNSIFRAVHDGIAHYPGRHSFGKVGEFRAFQAHCRLLTPVARMALATETLGQNAWYHYGRKETPEMYAPQKAALLPPEMIRRALELEV